MHTIMLIESMRAKRNIHDGFIVRCHVGAVVLPFLCNIFWGWVGDGACLFAVRLCELLLQADISLGVLITHSS